VSDESSDPYWDSVTAYYPPQERTASAVRWQTTELDLHGCSLTAVSDEVWELTHLAELVAGNPLTHVPPAVADRFRIG